MAEGKVTILLTVEDDYTALLRQAKAQIASFAREGQKELQRHIKAFEENRKAVLGYGRDVRRAMQEATGAFRRAGEVMEDLRRRMFSLRNLLMAGIAGISLKNLVEGFIEAGSEVEGYRAQLEALTGSAEEADAMLRDLIDYARNTPFSTKGVVEAATQLRAYTGLAKDLIPVLGDLAAAFNRDIGDALYAFTAAMTGQSEVLRRWGVTMMQEADRVTFKWKEAGQDMVLTVRRDNDEIARALTRVFEQYSGAMDRFKGTWRGMIMTLQSYWWEFQKAVAESGLMDTLKGYLRGLLDEIERLQKEHALEFWAKRISEALSDLIEKTISAARWIWEHRRAILLFAGAIVASRIIFLLKDMYTALMSVITAGRLFLGVVGTLTGGPLAGLVIGLTAIAGALGMIALRGREARGELQGIQVLWEEVYKNAPDHAMKLVGAAKMIYDNLKEFGKVALPREIWDKYSEAIKKVAKDEGYFIRVTEKETGVMLELREAISGTADAIVKEFGEAEKTLEDLASEFGVLTEGQAKELVQDFIQLKESGALSAEQLVKAWDALTRRLERGGLDVAAIVGKETVEAMDALKESIEEANAAAEHEALVNFIMGLEVEAPKAKDAVRELLDQIQETSREPGPQEVAEAIVRLSAETGKSIDEVYALYQQLGDIHQVAEVLKGDFGVQLRDAMAGWSNYARTAAQAVASAVEGVAQAIAEQFTVMLPGTVEDQIVQLEARRDEIQMEMDALREQLETARAEGLEEEAQQIQERIEAYQTQYEEISKSLEDLQQRTQNAFYQIYRTFAKTMIEGLVKDVSAKVIPNLRNIGPVLSEIGGEFVTMGRSAISIIGELITSLGQQIFQILRTAGAYILNAIAAISKWLAETLGPAAIVAIPAAVAGMLALWNSIKSKLGFQYGGLVEMLREQSSMLALAGGLVALGPSGPDQVPAWLTRGEFVIRREVVERVGVHRLEALNRTGRFQEGGIVGIGTVGGRPVHIVQQIQVTIQGGDPLAVREAVLETLEEERGKLASLIQDLQEKGYL